MRVGVHAFESRSNEAQGNEAVIWGSVIGETRPLYSDMAAWLNCILSNINHCHYIFIDIVLYLFLIIGVYSFDSRPNGAGHWFVRFGEDRLGKQWQGPIQGNDRLSELYSIECYIFSLTFNSFLILRDHSFASRPNGTAIWVVSLGTQ